MGLILFSLQHLRLPTFRISPHHFEGPLFPNFSHSLLPFLFKLLYKFFLHSLPLNCWCSQVPPLSAHSTTFQGKAIYTHGFHFHVYHDDSHKYPKSSALCVFISNAYTSLRLMPHRAFQARHVPN